VEKRIPGQKRTWVSDPSQKTTARKPVRGERVLLGSGRVAEREPYWGKRKESGVKEGPGGISFWEKDQQKANENWQQRKMVEGGNG